MLNIPTGQGWHAGMRVLDILNQLSNIYSKPTLAALEAKNNIFQGLYLAADAPEALFCWIKDCVKVALLGKNPYPNKQLVLTTICLFFGTGLYVRAFEEWDLLADVN